MKQNEESGQMKKDFGPFFFHNFFLSREKTAIGWKYFEER